MRGYGYLVVTALALGAVYTAFGASRSFANWGEPDLVDYTAPPSGLTVSKLLTITSDKNSNVDDLDIALDSTGAPQGVEVALEGATPDTTPLFFSLSDITSSTGAVLNQTDGYNALILQGTLDPTAPSSTMTLSYLANGLTGEYDNCDVIITHAADGSWGVQNAYTEAPVQSIKITTWTLGVTTVEGICPAAS
jgi:hypothetical protein